MNLREVRKKIKSISNVKKITGAMGLVSAIKMKKAQEKALKGKPYREGLERILKRLVEGVDPSLSSLLQPNESDRELVIFIASNKGLCGSFNVNLFKFSVDNLDFNRTDFIVVGKKAILVINRLGGNIIADFSSNRPLLNVSAIISLSLTRFLEGKCRRVWLVYNRFISALKYQPVKEEIIPVSFIEKLGEIKKEEVEYIIEPSPQLIIEPLLKSFIEEKIRGAIISSEAGEHSARMIAMKNATDNAKGLIYELTLFRNKLRQEKITYELLDMITAKESVEMS